MGPLPGTVSLTPDRPTVRRLATPELGPVEISQVQRMLVAAFGPDEEERFTDDDWDHALGGVHFVVDQRGGIVAHASVVERELHVAGRPVRTGYVEAVATLADRQGEGLC